MPFAVALIDMPLLEVWCSARFLIVPLNEGDTEIALCSQLMRIE